jgi:hypothetical protein
VQRWCAICAEPHSQYMGDSFVPFPPGAGTCLTLLDVTPRRPWSRSSQPFYLGELNARTYLQHDRLPLAQPFQLEKALTHIGASVEYPRRGGSCWTGKVCCDVS